MRARLVLAAAVSVLTACGGGGGGGSRPGKYTTPAGTPDGAPTAQAVGPAGGTVATGDGRFAVEVPPGALAAETTVTIQPITSTIHGIGPAYRIDSGGQVRALPFTLHFTYEDGDLSATGPAALAVARQQADGSWAILQDGTSTEDRKVTVALPATAAAVRAAGAAARASETADDLALFAARKISPSSASVHTSGTAAFELQQCVHMTSDDDVLADLVDNCKTVPQPNGVTWSVDWVTGGTATKGTVSGTGVSATYTAPASRPDPSTVLVGAEYKPPVWGYTGTAVFRVWAPVTITGADYAGDFTFQYFGGLPGTAGYAGHGHLELSNSCDPGVSCTYYEGTGSVVMESFTSPDTSCTIAANQAQAKVTMQLDPITFGDGTYYWSFFPASWTATATCVGKDAGTGTMPLNFSFTPTPTCADHWTYSDSASLEGSISCPVLGSVDWTISGK
jgi:hypothetical protein